MKKYFDILEIPQGSITDVVKKAYYKLAKKYHPDLCKDADAKEKFIAINEAYELLTNPDLCYRMKRAKKRPQTETKPTANEFRRAQHKAKMKAKMSAEEFKRYRMKAFKRDKAKLLQIWMAILAMPVIIALVVWSGIGPGEKESFGNLPTNIFIALLFPAGINALLIFRVFLKTTSHQKYFNE